MPGLLDPLVDASGPVPCGRFGAVETTEDTTLELEWLVRAMGLTVASMGMIVTHVDGSH